MALRQMANRVSNGLRSWWTGAPASRTYIYDPRIDAFQSQLTRRITFSRIEAILDGARNGELADCLRFFEEMEERDLRLQGLANTRRRAVTLLDYEIVSAAEVMQDRVDRKKADDAAAYVREVIDRLPGWSVALEHLSTAVGPNLAVLETVWADGQPVEVFPVPSRRLRMELTRSEEIRLVTADDRVGVACAAPKHIVHIPDCRSGSPIARSLSAAQGWVWLIKKLALSDWATFAEIFGMPVRIGRYDTTATPDEKQVLREALEKLGPSGWAMFSKAVELELKESVGRGVSPHQALVEFANREMAVAWLGGNLTSDTTGGTGTHAAGAVQDQLRDDLRDDDIQREARTIRDQFFAAVVDLKFVGLQFPVPFFRRIKPETIDRIQEANLIGQAQKIGMKIPAEWAHSRLNIPKPQEGEEVLEPVDAFEFGLGDTKEGLAGAPDQGVKGKGEDDERGKDPAVDDVGDEEIEEGGDLV